MNIVQNAFKLEFGRKTGETLQDIFYNSIYGMFVPVTSFNGLKNKAIIFHISKEQIEYALTLLCQFMRFFIKSYDFSS